MTGGDTPSSPLSYFDAAMDSPVTKAVSGGTVAVFSRTCPGKETPNEDSASVIPWNDSGVILVVADGVGGARGGAQASRLAVESIRRSVLATVSSGMALREGILRGFERANEAIMGLGIGAATTLAVVSVESGRFRSYHAGDSEVWVVGQRGKVKHQSVSHSPVGYAVESGLIDAADAMDHEERHFVSNLVGYPEMRIEVSPSFNLAPRDTVVIGSDGLFDNLRPEEIMSQVRCGPLLEKMEVLAGTCTARMAGSDGSGKPDDLTVILYRGSQRRPGASTPR